MIQPSELRLGNLVHNRHNEVIEVDWKDLHNMCQPRMDGNGYSGIPLTTEWLEKLGFTVEYTIGGWLRWQKGDFKLLDRKLPHDGPKDPVLYVHQLQNLYHALTGNELEIKT